MNLTPEQQELGRRNFLRVLSGTPALAALGVAAAAKGPVRGGPVRLGFIGLGGQGRLLLEQTDPRYAEVVALCDINPLQLQKADESLVKTSPPAREALRRLAGDDPEGEARGRRDRLAALHPHATSQWPAWRRACTCCARR